MPPKTSAQQRALASCVYVVGKQLAARGWTIDVVGDPQKDTSVSFTVKGDTSVTVSHGATGADGLQIAAGSKVERLKQLRFDPQKNMMSGPNGQDAVRFVQSRLEKLLGGKSPPTA
jgi:hypothetical protein